MIYANAQPITRSCRKLKEYHRQGFTIVINTSRNMRTPKAILALLIQKHVANYHRLVGTSADIPYDELYVGKPWCGFEDVDDKAIRPDELVKFMQRFASYLI